MAVKHLIENFIPENYEVFLDIDRKAKTIKGKTVITGEAKNLPVAFHAKDLEINKITFLGTDTSFTLNSAAEEVLVNLTEKGIVSLSIEYEAKLTDNMMGIYPSYYEINGEKRQLVSTQFESHFARQAFPCIDEPEAKATFDLSIKFDEEANDIIVSNMPEIEQKDGIHFFKRTVKMSSYLLAFAFGDMQAVKGKTKTGVEVGIFSTKVHAPESLEFAKDIAIKAIEFYEDYFGVAYPLPHSWHIALPDFSAGAMENWGCITYREACLIAEPHATQSTKQYVATVVAHELAHQWFGDLVTMKWWDDLWLNESFANMMEYVAVDAIHPEWNLWSQFSAVEANLALNRDAIDGVQSVHVEVNEPEEINTLFDPAIVYAKGARLMVMLRFWLGDKNFSKGLNDYFDTHKYGNTQGKDLWAALSEASGRDVAVFMNSWLEQPGYPVLTVNYYDGKLVLSQEQFFTGEGEEKGRIWQIPLRSNYDALPEVMTAERLEIPNFKLEEGKPLLINQENTAHYIVNYDATLLDAILTNLDSQDDLTKFQLLQDLKLLTKAQRVEYSTLIEILGYYSGEKSYTVSNAVNQLLADLAIFIEEGAEADVAFKSLRNKLFVKEYARLGWTQIKGESADDEALRTLVLSNLIIGENKDAVEKAKKLYLEFESDTSKIPADVRPIVLINEIKVSDSVELADKFFADYKSSSESFYKRELGAALSNTKLDSVVETILDAQKDAEQIKPQDLFFWYNYLIKKDFTQKKVWNWLKANWDWVVKKLGGDMSFDHYITYSGNTFKTAEMLAEAKAFFEPRKGQLGLERGINMALTEISDRVELVESQKEAVTSSVVALEKKL
ncbi:M1 family metallopeptidase [Lactovum miscens]|uniref:Aminopeptidase n=1 Tax=Lactovum miscens TaxID=190387 RepID=A0A841C6K2_9LACT|nr:M1 family metallopeptidase [Lactovum miscens]MBB5888095.1 aminopeptidase N [Lactovum miscens]